MGRINSLENCLTDIADAIRRKTKTTDTILAKEFDEAINSIQSSDKVNGKLQEFSVGNNNISKGDFVKYIEKTGGSGFKEITSVRSKYEIMEVVVDNRVGDKYNYIYSITCKDINNRQNEFEGTKYFGGYLKENEEMQKFEMLDDDSLCVETVGRNEEGNLIIKIGNQEIQTDGYVLGSSTTKSEDSTFEIKLIDSIGISRVFSKAKFTKEACKQIIEDYEKRMDQEER